jgi:predicted restriction endonuclease
MSDKNEFNIKEKKCTVCNIKYSTRFEKSKFCSQDCDCLYRRQLTISKWKEGKVKGYKGKVMNVSPWLRRYMFEKYNSKCCKCGWCEINSSTNKTPLEVNHIDGDASNTTENNLELLCPNCHSLTPNFRALNKNSKRDRK